jgi:hypothetical protein
MINLHEYELDPLKGELYKNGKKCGYKRMDGYFDMRCGGGKRIRLHRVIYMFVYGDIPDGLVIDHIDNNRGNNRPWNLQAIPQSQNTYKEKTRKSGFHNIYITESKTYCVQVKHKGPQKRFKSISEALEYRDWLLSLP